jgi:hypothetical protein
LLKNRQKTSKSLLNEKKWIRKVYRNASVVSLQEKKEVIGVARRGIELEAVLRVIEKQT